MQEWEYRVERCRLDPGGDWMLGGGAGSWRLADGLQALGAQGWELVGMQLEQITWVQSGNDSEPINFQSIYVFKRPKAGFTGYTPEQLEKLERPSIG